MRLVTAGESHGPAVVAVLTGMPAGLTLDRAAIDADLRRRQGGYGRGGRQAIEHDEVEVLAGLRGGVTLGSPVCLVVRNRDFDRWRATMDPWAPPTDPAPLTCPRPGHADLAGALKLGTRDARPVLERASARATVARVAAGAVAKALLAEFGAQVVGHVLSIGDEVAADEALPRDDARALRRAAEASPVRCADPAASARMCAHIDAVRAAGDTLGGIVEVIAFGVPPGLGGYAEEEARLDGRLAAAVLSVPALKGVEVGEAFAAARRRGSTVHDPIAYDAGARAFARPTNRAGGIEGGVSNGAPVWLRAAMKPIPTLQRPLPSVDLQSKEAAAAAAERSDVVAVPAAAVVAEAAVALTLADALCEKLGGDSLAEMRRNHEGYLKALREL
ncbi:MAG: chorismate synthase [Deltaproteobacteria bacterium]|nr:chorismate synthase [Deltaproteobacteria bacterium]